MFKKTGIAISGLVVAIYILLFSSGRYTLTNETVEAIVKDSTHKTILDPTIQNLIGKEYNSKLRFISDLEGAMDKGFENHAEKINDYQFHQYLFNLTINSLHGFIAENKELLLSILILSLAISGFLVILDDLKKPVSRNNEKVYTDPMTAGKVTGIILSIFLVTFYIFLYWFPEYLGEWIIMTDPISERLSGLPSGQWFMYGFLYTLAIWIMGVRMMVKHRNSNYHLIRTTSIIFFQTCFAFIIPEIMVSLNKPYYDFKNIWPLDYDFFFDWNLNTLLSSGNTGIFMLFWGILLALIAVPIFTYFYGKRWYCSWVCGCGGLAETAGDPYRHLSDKSLKAWKIERFIVYPILVIAVVMTGITIFNYITANQYLGNAGYKIQQAYGFLIGSIFSGVVGTGLYPVMGNRVWCRFGCPLAAYLGIVQRFKSRFRITTNGGQCISCGNCSTYCEMGIDVRWYAQRQQNIVRASCVGCGICATVCPRGVLKLENGPEEGRIYDQPHIL